MSTFLSEELPPEQRDLDLIALASQNHQMPLQTLFVQANTVIHARRKVGTLPAGQPIEEWPIATARPGEEIDSETAPEAFAERQAQVAALRQFFVNGFAALRHKGTNDPMVISTQKIMIPNSEQRHATLRNLRDAARTIDEIVDEEEAAFAQTLRDVRLGVMQLLGDIINLAVEHGDPGHALETLRYLTAPVVQDNQELSLKDLPWGAQNQNNTRRNVLEQRVQNMKLQDKAGKADTAQRELAVYFRERREFEVIDKLRSAYDRAAERMGLGSYYQQYVEWRWTLFASLQKQIPAIYEKHPSKIDDIIKVLEDLAQEIDAATERQQIVNAINNCKNKILPALAAAEGPQIN
ncbi:hypothetical protein COV82_04545 [Candidatus Peregrinibacteria bacterium CG11_big_fil_rev_8_21_14_0_20_46_8]|nr:MAG: hypothetical protein COV82_04545 [Candidatus Peregrinibacteria bacterium CG11_big_fil_rev_8_21_14_0_20_46_8]